jgi:hypothetical protein
MPHNDEFSSPMMDMILGYKHQHLQESYVTNFFSMSKTTLGKDLLYLDTIVGVHSQSKPW